MGNVHSAECGSLIRPLIYLTGKSVAFSHAHAAPTQAAIPTRDSANQSIQELHQDEGIRIPGFLISQSRFIIIDSKPARRYQAAA